MAIIDKPTDYFNTVLWTGNGSARSITGVGFQPDLVWGKNRGNDDNDYLMDSLRGATKRITTNNSQPEGTSTGLLTSFNSDGFSLGTSAGLNASGVTAVAWNWKAGTSFTNDASATGIGSIDSAGSVNTDAGFSIVTYTGDGTNNDTAKFFHGLASAPNYIVIKCRSEAGNWQTSSTALGWNNVLTMDNTAAAAANTYAFGVSGVTPTSTVVTVSASSGGNHTNTNNATYVAYCFAEKQGYSKFGSYTGNGNADGTFVYTGGMKPAFVMIKRTDSTANWHIQDIKRDTYNPADTSLFADTIDVDTTSSGYATDFLSNGFKLRGTTTARNGSGATYIYMAFAENPFVTSTGVPATAR